MTLVEVLIAVLLLSAVVGGLAIAVTSGIRTQSATKSAKSLNGVAQRVFESVRADRGWAQDCETPTACQDVNLVPHVPPKVLEDETVGSCSSDGSSLDSNPSSGGLPDGSGSVGAESVSDSSTRGKRESDGAYRHLLTQAVAVPVDSEVDGKADMDADRKWPDYYQVRIVVAVDPCAAGRLGNPQPAVFESAVDRDGKVPKGTLVVEVCRATNQVDDRMSIGGCAAGAGDSFTMFDCPPDRSFAPAAGCPEALDGVAQRHPGSKGTNGGPSLSVNLQRHDASFDIVDMNGNRVTGTSDDEVRRPEPGLYEFPNVDAGVYRIQKIVPASTLQGGGDLELWDTKLIPSVDEDGAGLIVQPEVESRGLITFRPKDTGMLTFDFKRRVSLYTTSRRTTGWMSVAKHHPTQKWEGPPDALDIAIAQTKAGAWIGQKLVDMDSMFGGDQWTVTPKVEHGVPSKNCVSMGAIWYNEDTGEKSYRPRKTCTWYDLSVNLTYYESQRLGAEDRDGAAIGMSLASRPAATFRYVVPPEQQAATRSSCPFGEEAAAFGGRVTYTTVGCVAHRDANNHILKLGPFATGLNTGLRGHRQGVRTSFRTDFVHDGGGAWNVHRNEAVTRIPQALKDYIWVRPDGTVEGSDGKTYTNGQPTIPVIGRGECYWVYGKLEQVGSCDVCEPYILDLDGVFSKCHILVKVEWKKHFYCDGDIAIANCEDRKSGVTGTLQACDGRPTAGSVANTAPNCSPTAPAPKACNSGCGSSGTLTRGRGIPPTPTNLGGGNTMSYATAVGT